jgi:membrane protein implicated in regulation of membrane protease activity
MSEPTIWGIAGLIMIIADVVLGTFFMLFLGGGALLTAVLVIAGVHDPVAQWLAFGGFSAMGVILFRKKLLTAFGPRKNERYVEHIGQKVRVVDAIPAHGQGRVLYRGSEWPARTADGSALDADSAAEITATDGILLTVAPIAG